MDGEAYFRLVFTGIVAVTGSAFGCYVGIRVALTEIRGELKRLDVEIREGKNLITLLVDDLKGARTDHEERLRWLEERCFSYGGRHHDENQRR